MCKLKYSIAQAQRHTCSHESICDINRWLPYREQIDLHEQIDFCERVQCCAWAVPYKHHTIGQLIFEDIKFCALSKFCKKLWKNFEATDKSQKIYSIAPIATVTHKVTRVHAKGTPWLPPWSAVCCPHFIIKNSCMW